MKKRILIVFVLLALAMGSAYSQGMSFSQLSENHETGLLSEASSQIQNEGDTKGGFVINFVLGFHLSNDNGLGLMQCEFGHMFSEVPLFLTPGLGYKNSWVWVEEYETPTYSRKKKYDYHYFSIPLYLGYLIGDREKLHVSVRGGVVWNYLVKAKYDDSNLDLDGYKRSSWNGSVRFALGWKGYTACAQYDFSFNSDSDGTWLFGFSIPF